MLSGAYQKLLRVFISCNSTISHRALLLALVAIASLVTSKAALAQGVEIWPSATGWATATAEQAGMDPAKLAKAIAYGRDRRGSGLVALGRVVGNGATRPPNIN